jgi:hypothetical protein
VAPLGLPFLLCIGASDIVSAAVARLDPAEDYDVSHALRANVGSRASFQFTRPRKEEAELTCKNYADDKPDEVI